MNCSSLTIAALCFVRVSKTLGPAPDHACAVTQSKELLQCKFTTMCQEPGYHMGVDKISHLFIDMFCMTSHEFTVCELIPI